MSHIKRYKNHFGLNRANKTVLKIKTCLFFFCFQLCGRIIKCKPTSQIFEITFFNWLFMSTLSHPYWSVSEKGLFVKHKVSQLCLMFCRSVFCGGGWHSWIYPDEGGQTLSGDSEHAATLPAPAGAPRGGAHPLHAAMKKTLSSTLPYL